LLSDYFLDGVAPNCPTGSNPLHLIIGAKSSYAVCCKSAFWGMVTYIMSRDKFDEFLRNVQESEANPYDWAPKISEWKSDIQSFFELIETYLSKYVREHRITINYDPVQFAEDGVGTFTSQVATIKMGSAVVKLEPVGLNIVGARARVDMRGNGGRVRFLLMDQKATQARHLVKIAYKQSPPVIVKQDVKWVWKLATSPPDIRFQDLTPDIFFDALMQVCNG